MKYHEIEYKKTFPLKDEKYQVIFDAFKSLDVVIAGGYCLTKVQALYGNFLSLANDLDIFCLDDNTYQNALTAAETIGHILNETDSAVTFSLEPERFPMPRAKAMTIYQIIKPPKKAYLSFDELIEDFDLNNSKYWTHAPFDTIYTKQDNRKLFEISSSKKKWNYHFLGRILKYHNKKHLVLPTDDTFTENALEIIKRKNKNVFKLDRSNYKVLDKNVEEHLENNLFSFILEMYKEIHPISYSITSEIKKGSVKFLFLERIFKNNIHRAFEYPASNFLFDYWMQKEYHIETSEEWGLVASVGTRLENAEFFENNIKKVKKVYPELLL